MSKLLHTITVESGVYEIYASLQVGDTIVAGEDQFTVDNDAHLATLKSGKLPVVEKGEQAKYVAPMDVRLAEALARAEKAEAKLDVESKDPKPRGRPKKEKTNA